MVLSYTARISRDGHRMAVTVWLNGRPLSSESFDGSEGSAAVYSWLDYWAMLVDLRYGVLVGYGQYQVSETL